MSSALRVHRSGCRWAGFVRTISFVILATNLGCSGDPEAPQDHLVVDLTRETFSVSRAAESADSTQDPTDDSLNLPAETRFDFYLDLPPDSSVVIDAVAGAPATIAIERAMGGGRQEQTIAIAEDPVRMPIPEATSGITLISIQTDPEVETPRAASLLRPRIVSTSAPTGRIDAPVIVSGSTVSGVAEKPNIIVYLIDALRADHLGVYGYDTPVSPHIDAFAETATVFEDAVAQTSWTRSAVASIFTGLDPLRTGVIGRDDALAQSAVTLAERLQGCGYSTAALIFNGNAGEKYNLDQGFDIHIRSRGGNYYSDVLNAELFKLLDSGQLEEPFFLYLHTIDPHAPYLPPAEWRERFAAGVEDPGIGEMDRLKKLKKERKKKSAIGEELDAALTADIIALYDAEIAHNDWTFGQLTEKLEAMDILDDSMFVFLADHGEEFWDHEGWPHGESLYNEVLRIPMILKHPGQQTGSRTETLVQQTDLHPTILDYAGCLAESDTAGRSLRGVVESIGELEDVPVFSVLDLDKRSGVSITTRDWKLIVPLSKHLGYRTLLFDRRSDPLETSDVFDTYPIVAGYMLTLLHQQQNLEAQPLVPDKAVVDEELAEELRALGYID